MAHEELNRLETCRFQRTKDGKWELGLLLNEGNLGVLDWHGKIVSEIWDYTRIPILALDDLQLHQEKFKQVFTPVQDTIAVDLETTKRVYVPLSEVYD